MCTRAYMHTCIHACTHVYTQTGMTFIYITIHHIHTSNKCTHKLITHIHANIRYIHRYAIYITRISYNTHGMYYNHTYMAYINYKHTCTQTHITKRMHIHTYIHTYTHALHTYLYTYIHTYMHAYIHTTIHILHAYNACSVCILYNVCMYVCMHICMYVR